MFIVGLRGNFKEILEVRVTKFDRGFIIRYRLYEWVVWFFFSEYIFGVFFFVIRIFSRVYGR